MTDRGYNNFYTPNEYAYQQYPFENHEEIPYYYPPEPYGPPPFDENRLENNINKFMEMQQKFQEQMQQMQDQHQQYLKNSLARSKNMEIQLSQIAKQIAENQIKEIQTNTQTTHEERDHTLTKNEEYGESVEECVETHEEETMFKGCGVEKIAEEPNTPHEIELPQEFPSTEEDDTVDNEEMMMDVGVIEGLFDKEGLNEQKKEIENKAEIDRVIDEICALFNKKELGRIWTPQQLFLKFMEFLPNRRKKTDDVLVVSFWPP
ncbi:hypothetical protein QL285_078889 [Trifolium repens]|nr:hypothetical protein QL285_078889 [Trifolium repens]